MEKQTSAFSFQLKAIRGIINRANPKSSLLKIFKLSSILTAFALLLSGPYLPKNNVLGGGVLYAASTGELQGQLNGLKGQIDSIQGNLSQKRNEKASLENEIAIMEGQIKALELQIESTRVEIAKTAQEIVETEQKIKETEAELEKQKEVIREHLRILYEQRVSAVEVVVSADNFSEFLDKNEYLQTMQKKVQDTAKIIELLKNDLDNKKKSLQTKKADLGHLRDQLEGQRQDLDSQRVKKDSLLQATKGQEAAYQAQLNEKKNSYASVESQIKSLLEASRAPSRQSQGAMPSYGSIKRGQTIGYQGSTGFSSGSHLHFGVYRGNVDVDPMPYLNNGTISWPLVNPTITQTFWGPYSHRGVGWPGGLDLIQYHGAPIRAAADGNIIFNGWMSGGFGHYIIMDHGNGLRTLYAHMQ